MTIRIAVVDDNPADYKLIELAIHRYDPKIEFILLEDGKLALEFFQDPDSPTCDLVLLDLNLPIVNGFEVLECLKQHRALKSLPVVVLSGSANRNDIERCYQLGANSYVLKPALIDEIFALGAEIVRYWFHFVQRARPVRPH